MDTSAPVYIGPSDLEKVALAFYQLQCSIAVLKVALLSQVGLEMDVGSFQTVTEDACTLLRVGSDSWAFLVDAGTAVSNIILNTFDGVASAVDSTVDWAWSTFSSFQYGFEAM